MRKQIYLFNPSCLPPIDAISIKGDKLQEANEEGKLSDRLKEIADSLTDGPFILMVLNLKQD